MSSGCYEELKKLKAKVKRLKIELNRYKYDSLTGVLMRRDFENDFQRMFSSGEEFYLSLIDVDGLHAVNRNKGYREGDLLLRSVATYLLDHAQNDLIYRIGGDEFVLLSIEYPDWLKDINNCQFSIIKREPEFSSTEEMFRQADEEIILKKSKLRRRRSDDR